jgi:toxin ParE1/3/4
MKVVVSARARADVLRVYRYLVDRNPAAADRVVERIERRIEQLGYFPLIGTERASLASRIRVTISGTHLIIYRVDPEAVVIVRIIDGRMDIDEEFRR